jgi:hypothetical protein
VVFFVSAFLVTSCLTAPLVRARHSPAQRVSRNRAASLTVVLLAIDGVRWQEVFGGVDRELAARHGLGAGERLSATALLPNLHALVEGGGVLLGKPDSGTDLFASGPAFVSLPGYAEMLTGKRNPDCRDNACGAARAPTFVDEIALAPGGRFTDVAVVTSWPDIGRIAATGPHRTAMSTGRNGGPTRERFRRDAVSRALMDEASFAASEPGAGDFRPDRYTANIAVRHLETAGPHFVFVALGEPDEYAHRGDYRGYLRALRQADLAIGAISRALDDKARQGSRTVLLVTTDHGRASDFENHGGEHPESARVFLFAWGTEVAAQGVAPTGARHLADIAPTLRVLFGLAPDHDPLAGRPFAGLFAGRKE